MGNYELLMVTAVTELNVILLGIFLLGSAVGLIIFSHILSWILKHYKDATLALLTGFILGSLSIIWPWKKVSNSIILEGKEKVLEYDWYIPLTMNKETLLACALILIGIVIVCGLENFSQKKN